MATFQIPTNPPYFPATNFNSAFNTSANTSNATVQSLLPYFLSYPQAQGKETLLDTTITGDIILTSSATFNTSTNLILDSTSNYIQFGDGTKQYTAPSPDDINTVYNDISNTFLSPTIQTFQGSNSSGPTTGPIKISNVDSGEYGTLYVDPSVNNDLTLYSAQGNSGGLTIRNATNSFTINPATVNGSNNWANFLNPINSTLGINAGYVNINGSSSSTLNVYAPSSTINYTQIRQENGSSTVIANSYWDGTNGGGTFFQFRNSTGYGSPFYITPGLVACLPTFTCSSAINAPQYNLSTSVGGSGINFKYYASGIASMNILGVDTFAIQNTGNNIMTFNYYDINAYKDINMNNNDINNCNSVNSSGTLNLTGTTVLINGSPIPSTAGFAVLNTATVQTFTGQVNFPSPLTSIPKVNYVYSSTQTNITTFAYQYSNYTLTYNYAIYNPSYTPSSTFTVNSLGVKRLVFGSLYNNGSFSTSNLYQITNPTIQQNNPPSTNTTPSVIVLANFVITPYIDYFDWSFEYTQPFMCVCSQGQQTTFIKASVITSYNDVTPIYNLQITLNALARNVNLFNSAIAYNINGFSLCWT
jgi:hypothetical protein